MKPAALLILAGITLAASVVAWRAFHGSPGNGDHDFSHRLEVDLALALQRLREAPEEDRKADFIRVSQLVTLADTLADVGDTRQKQVATAAKKDAGRLLFGEESLAAGAGQNTSQRAQQVVPFPDPLPPQQFSSGPMQIYVGVYSGRLLERPVSFAITITERGLLGVQIFGLGEQPTMEFAEIRPHEFFRPDSMVAITFADATAQGFRTLHFNQRGLAAVARNTTFLSSASK